MTAAVTERMAAAGRAWLGSLDATQRACATWPWPATEERRRWYYTPTDHGGLPLAAMSGAQQRLAMQLLATGLSHAGYVTVATIMGLDNVLDHLEGWSVDVGRERGRDPRMYWVSIFGEPGPGPWSWRFGGHHVSIHHTVLDGEVVAGTPCFLGADPACAPLLGPHPLRPLAGIEDTARDLMHSLDPEQANRALLTPVAPVDIVGGNRPAILGGELPIPLPDVWRAPFTDPRQNARLVAMQQAAEQKSGARPTDHEAVRLTARPKGIPAADLTGTQQQQLRELLALYLGRVPDSLADREAAKFAGDRLAAVHLAWAGSLQPGRPHYYRLQGPRLLVEYDNTQRDANHVHSVWRDPEGDFGADVLAGHLTAQH